MLKLKQKLNDIMVHGIQDFPSLLTKRHQDDRECFQIEDSWREFADKTKLRKLDKKQTDQQKAVWEIIKTEVCFIKDIRIVEDLYLSSLLNLQAAGMLNEIETEKMFGNISAIEKLHTKFWKGRLSDILKKARAEKRLLSVFDLADALKGWFEDLFVPYIEFVTSQSKCMKYLKYRMKDEMFRLFVEWAQKHSRSRGIKLQDLLDYPVRRLTKYPLLLTTLEKTVDRQTQAEVYKAVCDLKWSAIRLSHEVREEQERIKIGFPNSPRTSKEYPAFNKSSSVEVAKHSDFVSDEATKMVKLQQMLHNFTTNRLPELPALLTFCAKREDDKECFQIEESWRAFGDQEKIGELDKNQTNQQDAIWEIIKTEVAFIQDIRIIVDVYLCTLLNLQASIVLNEIETERVFSNISAVENLHTRFWREKLSNVVMKARAEQRLLSVVDLVEAFKGFSDLFAPYVEFSSTQKMCIKYLTDQIKQNKMFRYFIDWAQAHPSSRGMTLQTLLDHPIQRIAKYPLLLGEIDKTLDVENKTVVPGVVSQVNEFVMRVSHDSRQTQEEEKMTEADEEMKTKNLSAVTGVRDRDSSCEYVDEISTALVSQDSKMFQLQQMLDDFMTNGLQDFQALLTFSSKEDDTECFQIENSWRAFVDEETISKLDKKQTNHQDAIWEIIQTEVGFIKHIRVISDFYVNTFLNLQAAGMLNEIETEKIFSNISEIEKLHTKFWKEKLSRVVKKARMEKRLLSAVDLAEAFEGFADLFAPYIEFCAAYDECKEYLRKQYNCNERLRFVLKWACRHPKSQRLKLSDGLCYPLGRFTKYPLFLRAVKRRTDDRSEAEVSIRESEVKEFVSRVPFQSRQKSAAGVATFVKGSAALSAHTTDSSCEYVDEIVTALVRQDSKTVQLQKILDEFTVGGLQDFPALLTFSTKRDEDDNKSLQIEESWRTLADQEELDKMDKKQTDQQDAIWEILKTEVSFIRDIRVVVDFYLCTLLNLQACILLNEIETEKIFCNISAIEKLHTKFWKEKLSKVIKKAQEEERLPSSEDLAEAFEGFARLFTPYTKFCTTHSRCMGYLREQIETNEMFRLFVEWAQRHPESGDFKLKDLLDLPMQRIAKYSLLLTATEDALDDETKEEMSKRISQVTEFEMQLHLDTAGDERVRTPTPLAARKSGIRIRHMISTEQHKMRELQHMLDDFMANGLPEFPALLSFSNKRDGDDMCLQIEESWRAFADQETLSRLDQKQANQQEAIWQIIATEIDFIKDARAIVDLYLGTFLNLQASIVLNEIETERVFGNITAIETLHTRFWKEKLCNVLKNAREGRTLPSPADIAEAFEGFEDLFAPYVEFCATHDERMKYLREQLGQNEMFKLFVEWAQRHPRSGGLSLQDLLENLMHRITKYPLLLAEMERTLDDEDKMEVSERVSRVKGFAMQVSHDSGQTPTGQEDVEQEDSETTLDCKEAKRVHDTDGSSEFVEEVVTALMSRDSKMDKLRQTLDDFKIYGLQDFKALLTFTAKREDEEFFKIEETWLSFTDQEKLSKMDNNQVKEQEAIWEIITTEVAFIRDIRVIVDLYLCTLINLQAAIILNEIKTERIFGSITAIEKLHTRFWIGKLSKISTKAREEKKLPSALDLAEALEGFADLFAPYIKFCAAQRKCLNYLREQIDNNEMFRFFVEWVERNPDSRGLKLRDLLDFPRRRIAKYPVILAAVESTASCQDTAEVSRRIAEVKEFVMRVPHKFSQDQAESEDAKMTLQLRLSQSDEGSKMLKLKKTLDDFMANGLEDFPCLHTFSSKRDDEECFQIEETWRAFANNNNLSELDQKDADQQEAIWEIISTEVSHVKEIRVIVDFYLCSLINLQAAGTLNDIATEKIFSNISAIEKLHTKFLKEKLLNVVEKARAERRLPSASCIVQAFEGFAKLFSPYTKFCSAHNKCLKYLKEKLKHDDAFRFFLKWAQKHPNSQTIKLEDFLSFPTQRIDRYPHLLAAVEKTLGDQHKTCIHAKISEVKGFLVRVDRVMQWDWERLHTV